jgi:hypothetical protein
MGKEGTNTTCKAKELLRLRHRKMHCALVEGTLHPAQSAAAACCLLAAAGCCWRRGPRPEGVTTGPPRSLTQEPPRAAIFEPRAMAAAVASPPGAPQPPQPLLGAAQATASVAASAADNDSDGAVGQPPAESGDHTLHVTASAHPGRDTGGEDEEIVGHEEGAGEGEDSVEEEEEEDSEEEEEADYQELRRRNIERNNRKLMELELTQSLVSAVGPATDPQNGLQREAKKRRRPRQPRQFDGPTRVSSRARKPSRHILEAQESEKIMGKEHSDVLAPLSDEEGPASSSSAQPHGGVGGTRRRKRRTAGWYARQGEEEYEGGAGDSGSGGVNDDDDEIESDGSTEGAGRGKRRRRRRRRRKCPRDPMAPRMPKPAFIFFSIANRDQIRLANHGWTMADVGRRLGELYRAHTEEERAHWAALATVRHGRPLIEITCPPPRHPRVHLSKLFHGAPFTPVSDRRLTGGATPWSSSNTWRAAERSSGVMMTTTGGGRRLASGGQPTDLQRSAGRLLLVSRSLRQLAALCPHRRTRRSGWEARRRRGDPPAGASCHRCALLPTDLPANACLHMPACLHACLHACVHMPAPEPYGRWHGPPSLCGYVRISRFTWVCATTTEPWTRNGRGGSTCSTSATSRRRKSAPELSRRRERRSHAKATHRMPPLPRRRTTPSLSSRGHRATRLRVTTARHHLHRRGRRRRRRRRRRRPRMGRSSAAMRTPLSPRVAARAALSLSIAECAGTRTARHGRDVWASATVPRSTWATSTTRSNVRRPVMPR